MASMSMKMKMENTALNHRSNQPTGERKRRDFFAPFSFKISKSMAKAYDYLFKLLLIGKNEFSISTESRTTSFFLLGDSGVGKVSDTTLRFPKKMIDSFRHVSFYVSVIPHSARRLSRRSELILKFARLN